MLMTAAGRTWISCVSLPVLNTVLKLKFVNLTKSSYCLLTLLRRSAAFAMVYSTVLHVHVAVLKSQNNCPRMEHSQLKLKAYEWWHSGSPQLYPPMLPGSLFLFRRASLWTRLHGIMEHLETWNSHIWCPAVYLHNLYISRYKSQAQEASHAGTLVVGIFVAGKRGDFVPCFPRELLWNSHEPLFWTSSSCKTVKYTPPNISFFIICVLYVYCGKRSL